MEHNEHWVCGWNDTQHGIDDCVKHNHEDSFQWALRMRRIAFTCLDTCCKTRRPYYLGVIACVNAYHQLGKVQRCTN